MHNLPQETVNSIIDHLSHDRKSLIACSAVSTRFIAAARRILFSEVVLECSSVCYFMELLDVPWCTIPPAIVRVVVREKKRKPWDSVQARAHYSPINRSRLVSDLRGVRCVKFEGVSLSNIPPPFLSLLHDLEGLRELEIHRMSFETPIDFFRYICTLPALEALSISKSSIEVTGLDMTLLRPKLPFCIPFLDVGKLSPGILTWFLAQDPIPPVHTFRVNLSGESTDVSTLRQFVDTMGPSIQNLQITLSPVAQQSHTPCLQAFSSFCNIRSLHLESYLRLGQEPESCQFKDLMSTILTRISSPIFETISLILSLYIDETLLFFGFPDDVLLSLFSWGSLAEMLDQSRQWGFHLTIKGLPPYQRRHTEQMLWKGPFATLADRGRFSVEFK